MVYTAPSLVCRARASSRRCDPSGMLAPQAQVVESAMCRRSRCRRRGVDRRGGAGIGSWRGCPGHCARGCGGRRAEKGGMSESAGKELPNAVRSGASHGKARADFAKLCSVPWEATPDSIPDMMLTSGPTLDMRRGTGPRSWDFRRSEDRNEAMELIRREGPYRVVSTRGGAARTRARTRCQRRRRMDQHIYSSPRRSTESAGPGWGRSARRGRRLVSCSLPLRCSRSFAGVAAGRAPMRSSPTGGPRQRQPTPPGFGESSSEEARRSGARMGNSPHRPRKMR